MSLIKRDKKTEIKLKIIAIFDNQIIENHLIANTRPFNSKVLNQHQTNIDIFILLHVFYYLFNDNSIDTPSCRFDSNLNVLPITQRLHAVSYFRVDN